MRARVGLAVVAAGAVVAGLSAVSTTPATAAPTAKVDARTAISEALAAIPAHRSDLKASAGETFNVRDVIVDQKGLRHVRVHRSFRGLNVIGADAVVHQAKDGKWLGVSQTLRAPSAVDTAPTVSAATAGRTALSAGRKAAEAPKLVIDARGAKARLAWQVRTLGTQKDGTPSRLLSTIDAKTGAVISTEEQIQTVGGQGRSLYSGTVTLETTQSGATFTMKDPTRGNTLTGDAQNKTDFCFGTICFVKAPTTLTPDADNQWGDNTNTNRQSAIVDAQYGSLTTWDYYKNVHGRNGIANDGKGYPSRVHYGNSYANAYWDGSQMTYGDGDGTTFGPLVSLDVAGHEMSHGVTERTAGLVYSGESGGLNEATSDIFGTLVEFYANNSVDVGDYLIGEKVRKTGGLALRYQDKPSRDTKSPDCWSSSTGGLDVHYSSGPANHWFYLLSEGSGAKTINGVDYNSPTCNGSTIAGIGRDKAGKIWYTALTKYFTSGTNYAGARTGSLSAAKDLYGHGSAEYNAVAAAWSAVNVN